MSRITRFTALLALTASLGMGACKPKVPTVPEVSVDELESNPKKNFELGVALLRTPDKTGAIDYQTALLRFQKAAELDKDNKHANFNAAWVAEILGREDIAATYYKAAFELDPTYEQAMFSLARVYNESGRGAEAVALFREFVEKNPEKLDIRNDLMVAMIAAEDYDSAVAEAQEILRRDNNNAEVYRNLSSMYFKQGRYGMSRLCAEKALELNEGDVGTYNNLGVTFLIQGEQDDAIEKFQTARKLTNNEGFEANINLGWIAVNSGDYQLAMQCFEAAVKDRPASVDAKLGLAIALRGVGEYERASTLYDQIIQADPKNQMAYFNAATLHEKYTKNFAKALKYLDGYIAVNQGKLGPDHEVFARKARITKSKEAEEARKAEDEKRKQAEIERKKRNEQLLKDLAKQVSDLEAKVNANTKCLGEDVLEQTMMIIEQAKMVVESNDADMAPDIKTFLDGEVGTIDAAVAECGGGAAPGGDDAP